MSWHYQAVKTKCPGIKGLPDIFMVGVHEIYHTGADEVSWTENPVDISIEESWAEDEGLTPKELLIKVIKMVLSDVEKYGVLDGTEG